MLESPSYFRVLQLQRNIEHVMEVILELKNYAVNHIISNKNYDSNTVAFTCTSSMVEVLNEVRLIAQTLYKDKITSTIYSSKFSFNPKDSASPHDFVIALIETLNTLFDRLKHLTRECKATRQYCAGIICNSLFNCLLKTTTKKFNKGLVENLQQDFQNIKKKLLLDDEFQAPKPYKRMEQFCKLLLLPEKELALIAENKLSRAKQFPALDEPKWLFDIVSKFKDGGFMSKNKALTILLHHLKQESGEKN